jgi:DNA-binding GntR family transcriptional regulator
VSGRNAAHGGAEVSRPHVTTPADGMLPASDLALVGAAPIARLAGSANVAPSQMADQVFEILRGWIVNGQLASGQRLRVREVAELMGTSVMPVREAIRRLEDSGLVVREPYKGATVRGLTLDELEQAYDVRILLEGSCARLGADAIGRDAVDVLHRHWEQLEAAALAGDVHEALRHDESLLGTLYAPSGNEVAIDIIRGLWDRCRPYKVLWASTAEFRGGVRIWRYKPELIEAARRNDGAAAERILRSSYEEAKRTLRALIEREPGSK